MKVVIASGNAGKIHEFRSLLAPFDFDVIPQTELTVPPAKETGLTFVENALIKARHAAAYLGLPALADDSGLVVPALKGEPGIYSARYAGEHATDSQNIEKLLAAMAALPDSKRDAYFYCALAFMQSEYDPAPIICCGKFHGKILKTPVGEQGFGYDPVFFVPAYACSSAQLAVRVKNQISHRGLAIQALTKELSVDSSGV